MRVNKNKQLHLRITESDYHKLKTKASSFRSISAFVLYAIKNCDNLDGKRKIDILIETTKELKEFQRLILLFSNNIHSIAMYCNRCTLLGIDDTEPLKEASKYINSSLYLAEKVNDLSNLLRRYITIGE